MFPVWGFDTSLGDGGGSRWWFSVRKRGNLESTCFKGRGVDELNVSCGESEMSSGRILVFSVFYILKGRFSLDSGQKAALFLRTTHIYD